MLLLGVLDTPVFLRRYLAAHNNANHDRLLALDT